MKYMTTNKGCKRFSRKFLLENIMRSVILCATLIWIQTLNIKACARDLKFLVTSIKWYLNRWFRGRDTCWACVRFSVLKLSTPTFDASPDVDIKGRKISPKKCEVRSYLSSLFYKMYLWICVNVLIGYILLS